MPELLKNLYNKKLITELGDEISIYYSEFDRKAFRRSVFDKHWKQKELKQRMRHIAECLHQYLPTNYKRAIKILEPVASKFTGFEYMFFQDYVECYGLADFDTSMKSLAHFTQYASAEFAIRAFILQNEKQTMKQMLLWARSDNHHVRRLASEGCRPRLPWAISLPAFKNDPQAVLKILKLLMEDKSDYVRRSVANNLNDIAKDHPDVVLDWAKRWLGKNKNTDQLIKHSCRTLLKQGDQKALSLFGFTDAKHVKLKKLELPAKVHLGNKLDFSFLLKTSRAHLGACRIEFAINFMKANGKHNRKIFKISEGNYDRREKQISKYFSFKKISTRRYYAGDHQLSILINGITRDTKPFELII